MSRLFCYLDIWCSSTAMLSTHQVSKVFHNFCGLWGLVGRCVVTWWVASLVLLVGSCVDAVGSLVRVEYVVTGKLAQNTQNLRAWRGYTGMMQCGADMMRSIFSPNPHEIKGICFGMVINVDMLASRFACVVLVPCDQSSVYAVLPCILQMWI